MNACCSPSSGARQGVADSRSNSGDLQSFHVSLPDNELRECLGRLWNLSPVSVTKNCRPGISNISAFAVIQVVSDRRSLRDNLIRDYTMSQSSACPGDLDSRMGSAGCFPGSVGDQLGSFLEKFFFALT